MFDGNDRENFVSRECVLDMALQNVLKTKEVGSNALSSLIVQTEQLERTREMAREASIGVNKTKKLLEKLRNLSFIGKAVKGSLFFFIILATMFILYRKVIG